MAPSSRGEGVRVHAVHVTSLRSSGLWPFINIFFEINLLVYGIKEKTGRDASDAADRPDSNLVRELLCHPSPVS